MSSRRVLVVGAGVAGLAAARALVSRDVDTTVIERRDDPPGPGLGLNLPGNAVRALDHLGIAGEVSAAGVPVVRREYRSAGGRLLFEVDEKAFWAGVAQPVCVRHGRLLQALGAGLEVRRGVALDHLDVEVDGVTAALSDGSSERYDYALGGDGIHSAVRAVVAPDAPRASLMTAASWRFVTRNPGVGSWTAWTGHGVVFLLIPVSTTDVYGYAASTRGSAVGDPGWLAGALSRFPAPVRRAIEQVRRTPTTLFHSPVEEVRTSSWHRGRVVLLGDAAHATGPVWAQGAALALEDALLIADLLVRRDDWSAVGAEWEASRRPRVEHVQQETDRLSRLAGLPDWLSHGLAPLAGPRAYRSTYGPLRTDPGPRPSASGPVGSARSAAWWPRRRSPR